MLTALVAIVAIYFIVFLAYVAVPGRWVSGYVMDPKTALPLRYHLNGLRVFFLAIVAWALACHYGLLPWDYLYTQRYALLGFACLIGIGFTLAIVLPAPKVGSIGSDLYLGRLENPQWLNGRIDAKMFLYLIGATLLELNLLSFAAHHVLLYPHDFSPGVLLYVGLFSFFLVEYLFFEQVHLYTYDFVAERVGFKLGWGCLVFYPFFYGVGLWTQAERPNPHVSSLWLCGCAALFFSGWVLARGANLQKYWFKRDPTRRAFGVLIAESLEHNGKRVLVSGFWGLSRHINYLGEITMATALTLSLGWPKSLGPWLYPAYYVALLFPRQYFDDERCAKKYGPLWDSYCQKVRWRIIPFVY